MLRPFVIGVLAALSGTVAASASQPISVSIRQLVAHPQQYAGKTVAVTAWFSCEFEAGCELGFSRSAPEHVKRISLDFPDDIAKAIDKAEPFSGWVHVVGRFEYSPRFRDIVHPTPRSSRPVQKGEIERQIVTIWQGFGFREFQIKVVGYRRI